MPFALADLAGLAFAAIAFLLAVAAAWLIDWLDRHIPNPGAFGFHPLGFIHGFLGDLGDTFVNEGEREALILRNLVVVQAHWASRIVRGIVSVLEHHAAQLQHVAGPALAGLAGALVEYADRRLWGEEQRARDAEHKALAAAAAAAAAAATLHDLIGQVHHRTVEADIAAAHDGAVAAAERSAADALADARTQLVTELGHDEGAIRALDRAVTSSLPAAIAATAAADQAALRATRNEVMGKLAATAQDLQANLGTVDRQLQGAIADARSAAQAAATADLSTAEGYATAQAAAAQQAASEAAATALQSTRTALQDQLAATNRQVAQMAATTTLTLPALPGLAPPGELTVPASVGALAAAVAGIITEVDTCMVSTCNDLSPNNIKNVLRSLWANLSAAGEIGLVAEAIRDPQGTAAAIAPVLDTIDGGAVRLLDALLSL